MIESGDRSIIQGFNLFMLIHTLFVRIFTNVSSKVCKCHFSCSLNFIEFKVYEAIQTIWTSIVKDKITQLLLNMTVQTNLVYAGWYFRELQLVFSVLNRWQHIVNSTSRAAQQSVLYDSAG